MDYIKKELPSFNLHMIKTDRFKTTTIEILFSRDIKKEEITVFNLLTSMLNYTSKKYNKRRFIAQQLEELYASRLFVNNYRLGNQYVADFTMKFLSDKYAEDGLFSNCVDFLKEILFNPNVIDNKFEKKSFDTVKSDEKSHIERLEEDRRKYSMLRLLELTDKDSNFSLNLKGYLEDLEKITRESLYDAYKEFMKCDRIDIFVIGDIDFDYTEKILKNKLDFGHVRGKDKTLLSPVKELRKELQEVVEEDNTNQAKLAISYILDDISDLERNYVFSLYNIILGGSSDSKFFKNIREKFSLCYYINSAAYRLDNLLTVTSGITKDNFSKVKILIEKEMNDIQKGNISDDELEKAKKYYCTSLDEMYDNPSQIIGIYFSIDKLKLVEIEERKKIINKITKEDIMTFAKKIHVDTIYMLGGDKR